MITQPGFSMRAFQTAREPWTFTTARGGTYAARELSTVRLIAYFNAIDGAAIPEREHALRQLLRDAFPERWSFLWLGDPVSELLRLPPRRRQEALDSFFGSLGVLVTPPGSRTN